MRDLLVVTPSRGRPGNIKRLYEKMRDTCGARTDLLVGIDADDPTYRDYPLEYRSKREKPGIYFISQDGMQRRVVEWINYLAMVKGHDYRAVGHFGDDCMPNTPDWDVSVLEALDECTPFAYGNDLSIERPPGSLCTHLFMRHSTYDQLGYFGPPSIQHMWVDLAWHQWGESAGMTYLDDVVIEHLHFLEGKAKYDPVYHASRQLVDADLVHLWEYVRDGLNADIQKVCPGADHVSPAQFLRNTQKRGAPVPVPDQFIQLASLR